MTKRILFMSVCKYIHTSVSFKDINTDKWESEECKVVKGLIKIESTGSFWACLNSQKHTNKMPALVSIYINIYAFSRRFYPKRLTLHSSYNFYISSALAFPGNRTHDIGVANAMLYQLSYRKAFKKKIYFPQSNKHIWLGEILKWQQPNKPAAVCH